MFRTADLTKRTIGLNFENNTAHLLLWAPEAKEVLIFMPGSGQKIALEPEGFGYWFVQTDLIKPGEVYQIILADKKGKEILRADPAALFQSQGVEGPSEAFDLKAFSWSDQDWKGIGLESYIFYEIHVGTATAPGTFEALVEKLDHLVDLGITAVEIMPVAQFPGDRNWGYDGVFPYAVQNSYGGPAALQHFVNTCHLKGLAVVLDVVYNHFGPEGNHFKDFGPYFTSKYHTPWGEAINFDDAYSDGVRHFYIENMLMWFRDFHIDAIRMDAVHAIHDFGAVHILSEMKRFAENLNAVTGRTCHLIAELDLNDPKYIRSRDLNGYGLDAQWIDEFHHALRVSAGQKQTGYYTEFNGVEHLAKSYRDAYVYDGFYSPNRHKTFGKPATGHPGYQFVVFSQNHDQVGNRMLGERTGTLCSFDMQKLLFGAIICSPYLPLLFMGEEWGETNPFLYFISHNDEKLIRAVQKGRRREFSFQIKGEVPDPQSENTFVKSKLNWDLLKKEQHKILFQYYKVLIHLRKNNPVFKTTNRDQLEVKAFDEENCLFLNRWTGDDQVICLMNFSGKLQNLHLPVELSSYQLVLDSAHPDWLGQKASIPITKGQQIVPVQAQSILIFVSQHV